MPDDHHTTATAVHTKEDSPKPEPSADTSITDERSDQRESSEGSDASRSRSPSSDDLRVDTQQHGQVLVNGTDTAQKRKRSHDDDGDEHSPKVEPRSVADRALVMLGDHGSTSPNHQPRTNGVSQYGPQTYAMLPGTPMMPVAWPEQNGLPTPDTPNSNGTDHHWAMSNGSLPNGYNRPVNGDATTPNRPRKRNFSNRTRTGCKTCRNRKKKCDERKPFCGNCEKAGQSCLGYSAAPTAARETTGSTRPPVQIQPVQIREGPPEAVNGVHHHVPDQTAGNKQQPFDERVQPQHATHATEPVSDQPRSTRPPGYPGQPSGHGLPWPPQQGQPHVTPSPSSHILNPSQAPHLDPRGGENSTSSPLRDMRPPTQTTSTAPPPGMTQQIHLPPPSSFASPVPPPSHPTHPSPYYPSQSSDLHGQPRHTDYAQHSRIPSYEHQPAPPPPPSSYGHRPLSKQSTPSTSGPPSTGALFFSSEEVERSKMLRHVRYAHENPTLLWDRARCEAATDKYDHLLALGPGVREDQKRETLSWILDPALDTYYKHNMPLCREKGLLSLNVTVKRGFKCSYGYNLKLLEGVFIDRDVTIDDAGKVEVGARAYIGEGTRIVTSLPCAEMVDRKGPATERVAKDVIIEAEVQIGAGCTILPGVRLGKGCTIVGGTVVEGDVETMHTFGPLEMLERLQKMQRQARW